ncbi:PAS domain S-box protein [Mariprofundus sp. EBB-1]|uniref:hybrid sensor histidine kinase/response regulator n=1 Tax=Mariprofundus sp. EBB-1 TaxID=2650971 RepID=UPI000EF1E3C7|nr:PAS domain S-box protein [Mariprofundus sp. EBB-1]RLL51716.1 PAS domain S-box protein [Mariprofundus sp. EBB-1]
MKVLIVDDYEDTRLILQANLESSGYTVTCAENGREALEMALSDKPDLIISDILMPEMDGFDLCRRIKTDAALCHIPFIFYTASYVEEADRELAMAAGGSRFIIKPMDRSEFMDIVRDVMNEFDQQRLDVPVAPLKPEDELELMHVRALSRKLDKKVWELELERRSMKQSERRLIESNEKLAATADLLQTVIATAPVRVFWKDRDSRYLGCNILFAQDAGFSNPEDMIGKTDDEIVWKDRADLYRADDQAVMTTGSPKLAHEELQATPDGNTLLLRTSKVPLLDVDHNIIGVLGCYDDITEHKRIEGELKDSEQRFRALFEQAAIGVAQLNNHTGEFIRVNQKFCDIVGYPKEEIEQLDFQTITHPDDLAEDLANMELLKAGKIREFTMEKRYCNKDDLIVWVNLTVSAMWEPGESPNFHIAVVEDISDRKNAEESLRKLSQAVEQAGESITITDCNGIIEYVNPSFTELTGYSGEDTIGKTPRILKSGNQNDAFYENMWATITSGKVWCDKLIDRTKSGKFYPAILTISPIKNRSGDITNYVGIQQDLSSYESLEEQFHQAQKMEAIGTLVGGIAHDFNNMLAGITGNLYLAKQKLQDSPDVIHKLSNVEDITFRAADMIHQLLTYARKDKVRVKQLPFSPFVKETFKFLRTSVPENIQLHQNVCSDAVLIEGDATQLHQVLMNLINNARDALEEVESPCITVKLETFHADKSFIDTHAYFKLGSYAHLSVQDNGCGIPKHQIEHLFEPFFTTKEVGKGTGLGLAMVFGAVKTHHGFIEVDSIEGEGATFHIYLPVLGQEEVVPSSEQENVPSEGHGEMVLLVDDEANVLETSKEVLISLGYQVLTATDGQQAVDLFKAHAEEINLCIMDIVMPVMSGVKAAQNIRHINPNVHIIFISGYDQNIQSDMENETVLSKPFSIESLSRLIRKKLDS